MAIHITKIELPKKVELELFAMRDVIPEKYAALLIRDLFIRHKIKAKINLVN